jgi:hypothetical protein
VLAAEDQPKSQLVKPVATVENLSPKVQFRQIKKNSKVFYKVKYRSGIPDRERGFFKNGSFHIATTPSGIVFIEPDSLKIAYRLLWRHLIGISSANEMGHATQNLLVGVAARSRTITGTLATAVAANMLQKKALVFQFRQIDGDRFIQEAIFEDSRNKKIRTTIMAARLKMIAQATR